MPQLIPLSIALPKQKNLKFKTHKGIRGPQPFINCLKHNQWSKVKHSMDGLITEEVYQQQAPQHYWYRIITKNHCYEGFISGVHLENKQNVISTHEAVISERVELFSDYLSAIDRQAEPLLLMHEDPNFSSKMGKSIYLNTPDYEFYEVNEKHQLWILTTEQCKELESFAKNCVQFHLADGHHRLASSLKWGEQHQKESVVLAYIMASNQLKNGMFYWAIETDPLPEILKNKLIEYNHSLPLYLKTKNKLFSIAIPKFEHPLLYLYHQILIPNNIAIRYFPEGTLPEEAEKQFSGFFGYEALSTKEIINFAKKGIHLPPKSTYLHPKLPTGLFLAPLSAN